MDDLLVDIDVELPEGGETVELCAVLGAQLLKVEAQLLVRHLHNTMLYSLQWNFLRCNYPESQSNFFFPKFPEISFSVKSFDANIGKASKRRSR